MQMNALPSKRFQPSLQLAVLPPASVSVSPSMAHILLVRLSSAPSAWTRAAHVIGTAAQMEPRSSHHAVLQIGRQSLNLLAQSRHRTSLWMSPAPRVVVDLATASP